MNVVVVDIAGRQWAIPVAEVCEVVTVTTVTPVPLAPPEIRGLSWLRGQALPVLEPARLLPASDGGRGPLAEERPSGSARQGRRAAAGAQSTPATAGAPVLPGAAISPGAVGTRGAAVPADAGQEREGAPGWLGVLVRQEGGEQRAVLLCRRVVAVAPRAEEMAVLDVGRLLTMVRQRVAETVAAGDGVTSGGDASGAAAPMAGNVLPGERPPGQWRARR